MLKTILGSIAVTGFLALSAVPAAADPPGAFIEIHVGRTRPPRVRYETRAAVPGPGFVWVAGYWDWQGDDWVWIPGRWERPEPHNYWVRARYVPEYGHWRYVPGHWSSWRVREGADYRSWKEEHRHRHLRGYDRHREEREHHGHRR
ncbi:MAG: hypothetical protein U1F43_07480 [Myxococcota bacterium]